jgi:hypothetical protein
LNYFLGCYVVVANNVDGGVGRDKSYFVNFAWLELPILNLDYVFALLSFTLYVHGSCYSFPGLTVDAQNLQDIESKARRYVIDYRSILDFSNVQLFSRLQTRSGDSMLANNYLTMRANKSQAR